MFLSILLFGWVKSISALQSWLEMKEMHMPIRACQNLTDCTAPPLIRATQACNKAITIVGHLAITRDLSLRSRNNTRKEEGNKATSMIFYGIQHNARAFWSFWFMPSSRPETLQLCHIAQHMRQRIVFCRLKVRFLGGGIKSKFITLTPQME